MKRKEKGGGKGQNGIQVYKEERESGKGETGDQVYIKRRKKTSDLEINELEGRWRNGGEDFHREQWKEGD